MSGRHLRLTLLGLLVCSVLMFMAVAAMGVSVLTAKSQAMVELKLQDKIADTQLTNLAQVKKDVEQYAYFKDVARTVIPADKDQARTVSEISQIAAQTGIGLQSITFPSSTLGAQTDTSAASASTQSLISQAKPVTGIAGVYSIELTITPQTGAQARPGQQPTYTKMLDFLKRIENNRRTAQITQVNIQPQAGGGTLVSFSLTINMFIKP